LFIIILSLREREWIVRHGTSHLWDNGVVTAGTCIQAAHVGDIKIIYLLN